MTDGHDPHHGHGHGSPFIQHHYDDASHQFDAGKLGIWFFLAQEVLFFSALFVAYILYRHHHPEIFAYAHYYLDVKWGAINTVVLIVSSVTAAWAVRCAQLNQKRGLIFCLAATIVCACGFLGIKYIEYSHKFHEGILYGSSFDPCVSSGGAQLMTRKDRCAGTRRSACRLDDIDQDPATPGYQVDCKVFEVQLQGGAEQGRRELPVCEMVAYPGGPPHAANPPCWELQKNPWVCKDDELAALVHYGDHATRGADVAIDLQCQSGPPPTDPDLEALVAGPGEGPAPGEPAFGAAHRPTTHDLLVEESMGPPPAHTNMFFSIYFAMTGLHGIHVLVGVFVFVWLLIRAIKGHFTPQYFGPIDYAALYWHLVDLIWIFLFPLLYLIH
jgi:cytochrome c oxidase subunit III